MKIPLKEPRLRKQVRFMEEKSRDWWKIITLVLLLLLLVNVLVIDFVLATAKGNKDLFDRIKSAEGRLRAISQKLLTDSFEDASDEATSSIKPTPTYFFAVKPTATPTPLAVEEEEVVEEKESGRVKEYYVPLGSAALSTENFQWKDTGIEAVLDLANYPGFIQASFEGTLSSITGNVEVRLYDVTDGYPLVDSTLISTQQDAKHYKSGGIIMPKGKKSLRVQMRTSLNSLASLDGARIRILVK